MKQSTYRIINLVQMYNLSVFFHPLVGSLISLCKHQIVKSKRRRKTRKQNIEALLQFSREQLGEKKKYRIPKESFSSSRTGKRSQIGGPKLVELALTAADQIKIEFGGW